MFRTWECDRFGDELLFMILCIIAFAFRRSTFISSSWLIILFEYQFFCTILVWQSLLPIVNFFCKRNFPCKNKSFILFTILNVCFLKKKFALILLLHLNFDAICQIAPRDNSVCMIASIVNKGMCKYQQVYQKQYNQMTLCAFWSKVSFSSSMLKVYIMWSYLILMFFFWSRPAYLKKIIKWNKNHGYKYMFTVNIRGVNYWPDSTG
jgi:hypothetical protein